MRRDLIRFSFIFTLICCLAMPVFAKKDKDEDKDTGKPPATEEEKPGKDKDQPEPPAQEEPPVEEPPVEVVPPIEEPVEEPLVEEPVEEEGEDDDKAKGNDKDKKKDEPPVEEEPPAEEPPAPAPAPVPAPAPAPVPAPSAKPSEFAATTSLPQAFTNHALVHADGRLYHLGGLGANGIYSANKAYYAAIESPGAIGAWTEAALLPRAVFDHAAAAWNKTLYILGGSQADIYNSRDRTPRPSNVVYYSTLNPDGSPGPWAAARPMPEPLVSHTAVVSDNTLYVSGGWRYGVLSNRVYSAPILADGSLGNWQAHNALPESLHSHAAVQDGTLYLLGGIDGNAYMQSTVYMSRIEAEGVIGTWSETTPLLRPLSMHAAAVVHGRIFVSGGMTGTEPTSEVSFAPILADRSLGEWEVAPSLPAPLYGHASTAVDGALYVSGGSDSAAAQSAVYAMVFEAQSAPVATADLHPNTLNLLSNGNFVTLYLEFPAFAAQASEIDPASVLIVSVNDQPAALAALAKPTGLGDENDNGIADLMVKFDRSSLAALMSAGDNRIEFQGRLKDGTVFSAEDTVWAKEPKKRLARKAAFKMPAVSYEHNGALGIVGNQGGKIKSAAKAAVDVPEGATNSGVHICVTPEDTSDDIKNTHREEAKLRKELKAAGPAIEYGPEGTQFQKPVTLELPYDAALLPDGAEEGGLQIHYWNPGKKEWEALVSAVDPEAGVVRAQTTHFSLYQVLSGGAPAAQEEGEPDFHFREVYAFPNPAKRGASPTFHMEAEAADRVELRVYDLSGQRVYAAAIDAAAMIDDGSGRGPVRSYEHVWDVASVGSGVYIFTVTAHKAGRKALRAGGKVAVVK